MSGAFGELANIIKKRLQKQGIGFEADVRSTEIPWEILREVSAQDLVEFGFESEFVGRLPVIVVFDELSKEDLVEILNNPNNPILLSKKQDFGAYGIDIKFEDKAIEKIAELASQEKTGARGLVAAIEKVLILFEKHLPSTSIRRLLVTPEMVDNPEAELVALKEKHYNDPQWQGRYARAEQRELEKVKTFVAKKAKDFHRLSGVDINETRSQLIAQMYTRNNTDINSAFDDFVAMHKQIKMEEASLVSELEIRLSFDEGAIDELISRAIETGHEAGALAFQLAKKLEYGLKLVRDRSDLDHFVITRDAVLDMDRYINDLVKRYYRKEDDRDLPRRG
jgi:hypothetical protein